MAWCELRDMMLRLTLDLLARSSRAHRRDAVHRWHKHAVHTALRVYLIVVIGISCWMCPFSAVVVLIPTTHNNTVCGSNKLWLWGKSNRTIWSNFISSFS